MESFFLCIMFHLCFTITTRFQSFLLIRPTTPSSLRAKKSSLALMPWFFFQVCYRLKESIKDVFYLIMNTSGKNELRRPIALDAKQYWFYKHGYPNIGNESTPPRFNSLKDLSIRGLQSPFLGLDVIKGPPRYLIRREPVSYPATTTNLSCFSLPMPEKNYYSSSYLP